jgi:hypothetical protein
MPRTLGDPDGVREAVPAIPSPREPATAKTHIARLLAKPQLRNRIQAVIMAYETGLGEPRERVTGQRVLPRPRLRSGGSGKSRAWATAHADHDERS